MKTQALGAGITKLFVGAALLAGAVALGGCAAASQPEAPATPPAEQVELTVSAAATLRSAFEQLQPEFERANNMKLVYNFGASGVLQKQIEGGAAVDVFASASPTQVDALISGGYISEEDTATFISNEVVIVVPAGNPGQITGPDDLAGATRLATGNPESAPHGTKAKEWLTNQGTWATLESKFVFGENAAQTTDYVARGEVDAALVFASEAAGRDDLEVVYVVPAEQIKPIRYVIAPLGGSQNAEAAAAFIDYVLSDASQQVLLDNGFVAAQAR